MLAKSEYLGRVHKRKMKGDKTAIRDISINRLMYINSKTMETIRNKTINTKVIRGVVPVMRAAGLTALTIQAWFNPPVLSKTVLIMALLVIIR